MLQAQVIEQTGVWNPWPYEEAWKKMNILSLLKWSSIIIYEINMYLFLMQKVIDKDLLLLCMATSSWKHFSHLQTSDRYYT
jgi:hypothetical protein